VDVAVTIDSMPGKGVVTSSSATCCTDDTATAPLSTDLALSVPCPGSEASCLPARSCSCSICRCRPANCSRLPIRLKVGSISQGRPSRLQREHGWTSVMQRTLDCRHCLHAVRVRLRDGVSTAIPFILTRRRNLRITSPQMIRFRAEDLTSFSTNSHADSAICTFCENGLFRRCDNSARLSLCSRGRTTGNKHREEALPIGYNP